MNMKPYCRQAVLKMVDKRVYLTFRSKDEVHARRYGYDQCVNGGITMNTSMSTINPAT